MADNDLKDLSGVEKIRRGISTLPWELREQTQGIIDAYCALTMPWSPEEEFKLGHEIYEALFLEVAIAPRMYRR